MSRNEKSLTGRYLSGAMSIPVPACRRRIAKSKMLTLEGATANNLKNLTVSFPLSAFTCVTGVSGSGKSTLLDETLARAVIRKLGGIAAKPGPHTALRGASKIDKVVQVDQSPIGAARGALPPPTAARSTKCGRCLPTPGTRDGGDTRRAVSATT